VAEANLAVAAQLDLNNLRLAAVREGLMEAPEMVRVEGGCFQMGSPGTEKGRDDDERQHRVCMEDFGIGKYEVTNGQYRRFRAGHDSGEYKGRSLNGNDQPVVRVSWEEATAYAEWLSRKMGQRYRLPTEAEWEYAARAGTQTAYWWGDEIGDNRANWSGCGSQWDSRETAPVGSFEANPWELHDTAGNVSKWTCSTYKEDYDGTEERCLGKNNASARRVLRGGSWLNVPRRVRSATRIGGSPDYRYVNLGFRLAQGL
jgi:formylglycine-generating enzyme required for sulfatase activity